MGRTQSNYQLLVWACAVLVVAAGRSEAQDSAASTRAAITNQLYRNRVLGVFDAESGLPVDDAEVIDILSGVSARTTRTGTVSLSFLPEGAAIVRIRKLGYEMQTMIVATAPADTVPITVILRRVVQLPEVVTYGTRRYISPHLRGFEQRRRTGASGYFLSEDELRKEDGRPLGDVLVSRVPGVHVVYNGFHMLLVRSPRCIGGGPPDVYLDGMAWPHPLNPARPSSRQRTSRSHGDSVLTVPRDSAVSPAAIQPIDLSDFHVWNLAGVEYYPDDLTMPPQFHHTPGACGALLLWTRER